MESVNHSSSDDDSSYDNCQLPQVFPLSDSEPDEAIEYLKKVRDEAHIIDKKMSQMPPVSTEQPCFLPYSPFRDFFQNGEYKFIDCWFVNSCVKEFDAMRKEIQNRRKSIKVKSVELHKKMDAEWENDDIIVALVSSIFECVILIANMIPQNKWGWSIEECIKLYGLLCGVDIPLIPDVSAALMEIMCSLIELRRKQIPEQKHVTALLVILAERFGLKIN